MAWKLEHGEVFSTLTSGKYGLTLSTEDLSELEAAATLGELHRVLLDIVGRGVQPERGRTDLRVALEAGPTSIHSQLREICGLVSPHPLLNVRSLSDGALRKMHEAIRSPTTTRPRRVGRSTGCASMETGERTPTSSKGNSALAARLSKR